MKFSLDDICLVPAITTEITHRSECNPYNSDSMLPLFTAPMSCVIDTNNYTTFMSNKINTIIPRNIDFNTRCKLCESTFVAMGLDEFQTFCSNLLSRFNHLTSYHICIDIANGHMKSLLDLCAEAKNIFGGNLVLMTGNIANPDTYFEYAKVGIDYVRVSIGNGTACSTAVNTGCFYPMGSLIIETVKNKRIVELQKQKDDFSNIPTFLSVPQIIADGGFNSYDKIIKALALGADYVMIGYLFSQTKEACAPVDENNMREYYGMSTQKAQVEFGKTTLKVSEGIHLKTPVTYSLSDWCDSFISYLRSSMSYTNSKTLEDFQLTRYERITPAAYSSYYK